MHDVVRSITSTLAAPDGTAVGDQTEGAASDQSELCRLAPPQRIVTFGHGPTGYGDDMTKVLIALDDSPEAVHTATGAFQLFGPAAEYMVINVADDVPRWASRPLGWGGVYDLPYLDPYAGDPFVHVAPEARPTAVELTSRARDVAGRAATKGGVDADAIGDLGDPTDAILSAARSHEVDVIVVGSSERPWWQRLLDRSVSMAVMHEARRPVLVVPHHRSDRTIDASS